jgi:hypothetical protein
MIRRRNVSERFTKMNTAHETTKSVFQPIQSFPIQPPHWLWSYLQEIASASSWIQHFTLPEHASRRLSTRSTIVAAQSTLHIAATQIHWPVSRMTCSDVARSLPTRSHLLDVSGPPHQHCQATDPEKSAAPSPTQSSHCLNTGWSSLPPNCRLKHPASCPIAAQLPTRAPCRPAYRANCFFFVESNESTVFCMEHVWATVIHQVMKWYCFDRIGIIFMYFVMSYIL